MNDTAQIQYVENEIECYRQWYYSADTKKSVDIRDALRDVLENQNKLHDVGINVGVNVGTNEDKVLALLFPMNSVSPLLTHFPLIHYNMQRMPLWSRCGSKCSSIQ